MAPDVSVIIVSYKCKEQTLSCVGHLIDHTDDTSLEIIVVDNASFDGTVEALAERFPEAEVVALSENLGFGRGCNEGAKIATGDHILFLNPDATVRPGAVDRLKAFSREFPDARIWGGVTVDAEGKAMVGSCWRFPTLWSTFCIVSGLSRLFPHTSVFNYEAYGGWDRESDRDVEIVSGCFLLIDPKLWEELGGFDPDYFLYSEEADLCLRAAKRGARPRICRQARVIHDAGGTQELKSDRYVFLLKGKVTYMRKNWPRLRRISGTVLLMMWPLSRYIFVSVPSLLPGRPKSAGGPTVWRDVWKRRDEWMRGY